MPRKPRIHYPGAVYHVMLRGNAGQNVFSDDADRTRFCLLLQNGIERFGHRIHAFCLMTNHLHLVMQVDEVPLSRIMQNLGFRYTQYHNRKRNQSGHLFQGRFKALLVDADSYLLELVRYIHLNPVRVGLVVRPEEYPWCSHHAYLGKQDIPWLTTDWVLGQFSRSDKEVRTCYFRFVDEGLGQGYRKEFHSGTFEGRALGQDHFIEQAMRKAGQVSDQGASIEDILTAVCTNFDLTPEVLAGRSRARSVSHARAVAAWLVREDGNLKLIDLARRLNHDLSSLSQAARRLDERGGAFLAGKIRDTIPICQA